MPQVKATKNFSGSGAHSVGDEFFLDDEAAARYLAAGVIELVHPEPIRGKALSYATKPGLSPSLHAAQALHAKIASYFVKA
jgi:hypothetical protein